MTTVPAQSFSAPARALVIAAARFIPGVCAVLTSSSFACTTRTPRCFHFDSVLMPRTERERSLARRRADDAVREVLHGEEHQVFFGKRLDRVHDVGGSVDQRAG